MPSQNDVLFKVTNLVLDGSDYSFEFVGLQYYVKIRDKKKKFEIDKGLSFCYKRLTLLSGVTQYPYMFVIVVIYFQCETRVSFYP